MDNKSNLPVSTAVQSPPGNAVGGKHVAPKQSQGSGPMAFIGVLTVISLLAFGTSFYGLMVLPKKATAIQKLRTQELSIQISEQDEQLLGQALKDTQSQRETLLTAFPDETSLLEFIHVIDKFRGTDVEIIRFSVDSDTPTKIGRNPRFLPMSLVIKGPEEAVNTALETIMNSPYFIRTVAFTKDYDPVKKQVTVQTQFHLFVADAFTKTHS